MLQKTVLQSISSQLRLSLNIENIDCLFPGFMLGDFAVLHNTSTIRSLSTLLCVRAQLPYQLGGLETTVVFVDGGNSFRLYDVSTVAQLHELDPREVLGRIFISRAFTVYQHVSLLFEQLEKAMNILYKYLNKGLDKISFIVNIFLTLFSLRDIFLKDLLYSL